jgi:hypothetical protein
MRLASRSAHHVAEADRISNAGTSSSRFVVHHLELQRQVRSLSTTPTIKMAAKNLPAAFNATSQDIEMLLSAQCHLGSKNMQVHMEPYLWKTRADGINVLNVGKTWYVPLATTVHGDDVGSNGVKEAI